MAMLNPFQFVSESFKDEFQVRFSIERMDGSITLSLADERGVVARRALSSEQLGDLSKLRQTVQSIRFGLAIDSGQGIRCLNQISAGAANEPLPAGD
jgi:hypothetical protein